MTSGKSVLIRPVFRSIVAVSALVVALPALAQSFHNAPASSASLKNPDTGKQNAVAGQKLYQERCASCHGATAQGTGNIPSLASGATQAAKPGEIFWFITHGDIANGMPAWDTLPEQQRWQIVTYLKYLKSPGAAQLAPQATVLPNRRPPCRLRRPSLPSPTFDTKSLARFARSQYRIFPRRLPPRPQATGRPLFPGRKVFGRRPPRDSKWNCTRPDSTIRA